MARKRGRSHTPPSAPLPPAPWKSALFASITVLMPFLILGALEIGLRAANYGGDTSLFERPGILGNVYIVPGKNVGRRYFPEERNAPSPPGDAFLVDKPAHGLRIFVMGESAAAGFPYPSNGTFSRVLRDALQDVLPRDTVEVVNLGIAATNSYTIADLAGDVIAQRPDAVIIYGGHNEYYGALGAGSTVSLGSYPAFVRLYLRLQRFKTFVLLRTFTTSALRAVRGGRSARDIEADATRMESVVRDQRITLGGETYQRGIRQYENNLRTAIGAFQRARVPVFIGSTPSNLRDLRPFGTSASPPDSSATMVFDSARAVLAAGDRPGAAAMFARARDLDVIRFRAPGEFQRVVMNVARDTRATYVPVLERFASVAEHGVPGDDLFLEHVHPNERGYVLIAKDYFEALRAERFLGREADTTRLDSWENYGRRMRLTDVDRRIAQHTVRTVTTRWPFVPISGQLDYRGTYRPSGYVDSLAFTASRGGIPWAQAKTMAADFYIARGDVNAAVEEYEGLIRDGPAIETAYRLAGRALLSSRQPQRARPYLEKAYSLSPTGFTAYALGLMAMQAKDIPRGIKLLEHSLQLSPDMPAALYQLSLAYGMVKNADRARATALRLAQIEPRYPGLGEWMSALGMLPR